MKISDTKAFDKYFFGLSLIEKKIDELKLKKIDQDILSHYTKIIRNKLNNKKLKLAVVGEFSSGKSTFINALLRDNILETSALETTAKAIHISHGSYLTVEAHFSGTKSGVLKTYSESQNITVPWMPSIKDLDNRQLIHALTTHNNLEDEVNYISITHPSKFLHENISVIDTPGINASLHYKSVTKDVIEFEADFLIILIPANIPLSLTLLHFLTNSINFTFQPCIFIITRIDQIKVNEQDKVFKNIQKRLIEHLGIKTPILYSSSAQTLLDCLYNEESTKNCQYWVDNFHELEKSILELVVPEYKKIIEKKIQLLFIKLSNKVESHYRLKKSRAIKLQKKVSNVTVPSTQINYVQEKTNIYKIFIEAKLYTVNSFSSSLTQSKNSFCSSILKQFDNISNEKELNTFISDEFPPLLEKYQQDIELIFRSEISCFVQRCESSIKDVDKKSFSEINNINFKIEEFIKKIKFSVDYATFDLSHINTNIKKLNEAFDEKDGSKAIKSLAGGIAVGTTIAPGIGSIIGGVAGFLSSSFFMDTIDFRKEKIMEQIESLLNDDYESKKLEFQKNFNENYKILIQNFNRSLDEFLVLYNNRINVLHSKKSLKLSCTEKEIKSIQKNLDEIFGLRSILQMN